MAKQQNQTFNFKTCANFSSSLKTCYRQVKKIRSETIYTAQRAVLLSIPSPHSTSLRCGLSIAIKAILISLFAALAAVPSSAQTCISWQTILGEEALDERATDIQYNPDDESFWVCGYQTAPFQSGASNSKNAWLFQTNLQGEVIHDFVLKDANDLVANALVQNTTGVFIGGYYHPVDSINKRRAWLAHYTKDTIQWISKKEELSEIKDIIQLDNGDLIIAGYLDVEDTLQKLVMIEKYKPNGRLDWSKTYGGSKNDEGNALSLIDENTVLLTGYTTSSNGDVSNLLGGRDAWLLAIEIETGRLLKEKTFGGSSNDVAVDVAVLPNKQIAFLSESLSNNGDISNSIGNGDFWLAMLSEDWEIVWEKSYGGLDSDFPQSMEVFPEGDLLISGTSFSSNGDIKVNYGFLDSWLVKIDQLDGSIIWNQVIGGNDLDQVAALSIYTDTKIALAGNTDSYNIQCKTKNNKHSNQNVWLFSIDGMLLNTAMPFLETEPIFTHFVNAPYIYMQNNSAQIMNVLITDIAGKTFFKATIAPTQKHSIHFADWKKGIYSLIYQNDSGLYSFQKMGLF